MSERQGMKKQLGTNGVTNNENLAAEDGTGTKNRATFHPDGGPRNVIY